MVRMNLLSRGIDDSIFTLEYPDSIPSLSLAAKNGNLSEIKKLISKGNLPHSSDNRGWTAIHCCAAANQVEALKLILKLKTKSKEFLLNLTTWENVTPLLIAAKAGPQSLEMVKLLLKSGASPKIYTHTKISPLHLACLKKGNLNLVKMLIEYGSEVNLQEDLGSCTPLHFAVSEAQDLEMIRYLVKISDLNISNIFERTPFLEACHINFSEAIQIFVDNDASILKIIHSIPPVTYAAAWGNLKITEFLLQSGVDLNTKCKAIISCDPNAKEIEVLDREYFLPIHSSLNNLHIFLLLLKLTDPSQILKLDTNFCTFSMFVILYGKNEYFFEALLQADVPETLKSYSSRVLINFLLGSPQMTDLILKKFTLFFKYNFYFEPNNIFQNFVCLMSKEELLKNYKFLYILAQMGISSDDEYEDKNFVVQCLKDFSHKTTDTKTLEVIKLTCDLLMQPVLSLKQLSRIVVRRYMKCTNKSDWLSFKLIKDSNLPESLKKFIFFDIFI